MARMVTPFAVQLAPWSLAETGRDAWLKMRRDGLGGSDIPAVVGMGGGRTRWHVYLSKVAPGLDDSEPEDGSRLAEMFWFGHEMENVAAKWFRNRHPGVRLTRCGLIASKAEPWMRVNVDFLGSGCPDGKCVVEVKNRSAWMASEWDADGDVENTPDDAAIQTTWGLTVLGGPPTGYTHGHLLVVIGGNELREYRVDWDADLAKVLTDEGRWMWFEHILPQVPPPVDAAEATGRILARLWDTDPDSIIVATALDADLVARLRAAEAAEDEAKAAARLLRHEVEEVMGPAEVLLDATGRKLASWKRNGTFRDKEFRAEHPDVAKLHTVTRDATDTKTLAEADPGLFREYRSRRFLLAPEPKDNA